MDLTKKDDDLDISLIVTGTGRGTTVIAHGSKEELDGIIDIVNRDVCNNGARIITVNVNRYNKYKDNIDELLKMIQS